MDSNIVVIIILCMIPVSAFLIWLVFRRLAQWEVRLSVESVQLEQMRQAATAEAAAV